MKLESPVTFYPTFCLQTLAKQVKWISLYVRMRLIYRKVRKDPARFEYSDLALESVTDREEERELFQSASAQEYLDKIHKIESITRGDYAKT